MIFSPVFVALFMIFLHIFDDYCLQAPTLANLKQKKYWIDNISVDQICFYKYDYIIALICHAFSWSFMVMLPIAIYMNFDLGWMFLAYPINIAIHAVVDDLKANRFKINLVEDQFIHFIQIAITFTAFAFYNGLV